MTVLLLWLAAFGAFTVVATQPAARTWLADAWVAGSFAIAIIATVARARDRKPQRRMEDWVTLTLTITSACTFRFDR